MAVKIITDSGADIPQEIIKDLGITVIPLYIYFGDKVYKDGIDITQDELYKRLAEGHIHPTTTQPMPVDFSNTYQPILEDGHDIVAVHLSSKVSGTVNAAIQGKEMVPAKGNIEVVDSYRVSIGTGMVAMAAARVAKAGGTITQVVNEARKSINEIKLMGVLDTLKYLLAGGRITKTKAMIGGLLNVKPILTMRDGELIQIGLSRTYAKGIDKLFEFAKNASPNITEIAIVHSTSPGEAESLKKRVSTVIDESKIIMGRLGAGLGVHGGPGTLIVATRQSL
jgi:DegV family protein with EDD domain